MKQASRRILALVLSVLLVLGTLPNGTAAEPPALPEKYAAKVTGITEGEKTGYVPASRGAQEGRPYLVLASGADIAMGHLDGAVTAVPVTVEDGRIMLEAAEAAQLCWTITDANGTRLSDGTQYLGRMNWTSGTLILGGLDSALRWTISETDQASGQYRLNCLVSASAHFLSCRDGSFCLGEDEADVRLYQQESGTAAYAVELSGIRTLLTLAAGQDGAEAQRAALEAAVEKTAGRYGTQAEAEAQCSAVNEAAAALYQALKFHVTYTWQDAPAQAVLPVDSQVYRCGDAVTVDPAYTAGSTIQSGDACYIFSGWFTDPDQTIPAQAFSIAGNTTLYGKWLRQTNRCLQLEAASASKVYDGQPLTADGFTVRFAGALCSPDDSGYYTIDTMRVKISAVTAGTITDAGTSPNRIVSYSVTDEAGQAVSCFQDVSTVDGTLEVRRADASITVSDASKYAGQADPAFTGSISGLVHPDDLGPVQFTRAPGFIGEAAGCYPNCLTAVYTPNDNYSVSVTPGTLTILPLPTVTYLLDGAADGEPEGHLPGEWVSLRPAPVRPGYTFSGWRIEGAGVPNGMFRMAAEDVVLSGTFTENAAVTITYSAAPGGSVSRSSEQVRPATGVATGAVAKADPGFRFVNWTDADGAVVCTTPQFCPPKAGGLYAAAVYTANFASDASVTLTARSASTTYTGLPQQVEGFETLTFWRNGACYTVDGLSASASGTDAGRYETAVTGTARIRDELGRDVTEQFSLTVQPGVLEICPAVLTAETASAEKAYDGLPLTAPGALHGLVHGETAALEVTGAQLDAGSSDNTCCVIWNGTAKADNYTVTQALGQLTVTPVAQPIVITASSAEKRYDGAPLQAGYTTNAAELLRPGDRLEVTLDGSQCDAGQSANRVAAWRVLRGHGEDAVEVTGNYTFAAPTPGTLTVTPRSVIFTSGSARKSYDGTALVNQTVAVTGDGFAPGEGAAFAVTGSRTMEGTGENTFFYTLYEGTRAENYTISCVTGTLEVTPYAGPVTVTATGGTYLYDGQPHGARVTVSGLPAGYLVRRAASSQRVTEATDRPAAALCDQLTIENAAGQDVTAQLDLHYISGSITIKPRPLTVRPRPVTAHYTGAVQTADSGYAAVSGTLAPGDTLGGTATAAGTGVGTYPLLGSPRIYTAEGRDVTDSYDLSVEPGVFSITDGLALDRQLRGGYMQGYPGGYFAPKRSMTRAEVAVMLSRLITQPLADAPAVFRDVPETAWYAKAVRFMASHGVITGYPDGTFRPDAPISRAEFVTLLTRLALSESDTAEPAPVTFSDVSRQMWFYDSVAKAASCGWVTGFADGSFRPGEQVTREQAVTMVNRVLGRSADPDEIRRALSAGRLPRYRDVSDSDWSFAHIYAASGDVDSINR